MLNFLGDFPSRRTFKAPKNSRLIKAPKKLQLSMVNSSLFGALKSLVFFHAMNSHQFSMLHKLICLYASLQHTSCTVEEGISSLHASKLPTKKLMLEKNETIEADTKGTVASRIYSDN